MENYSNLISISSLTLAVFAIILAIWQTKIAVKQTKEATEQTKNLSRHEDNLIAIKEALSTKYLGQFPMFHEDIANLINNAKQKIVLFIDIPGYGLFSNPNGWLKIKQSIELKINQGINIEVTLYSEKKRNLIINEQFYHKGKDFSNWINSEEMSEKVNLFLKKHGQEVTKKDITIDKYIELSEKAQNSVLKETFSGLRTYEVDELIPIYYWLIDDAEAIIAIPAFTKDASEFGFYTSDKSLINALLEMKKRYIK